MSEQVSRTGLSDTLDRILREVETPREAGDDFPADAETEGAPAETVSPAWAEANPFGTLLGGLAGNPALLSAIPALVENLGPLLGGGGGGKSAVAKPIAPSLDRHTALLCAVKPYLGSERQEAAERIIRLCRAWDALQKSGLTEILRGVVPVSAPQDAGEPKGKGDDGHV